MEDVKIGKKIRFLRILNKYSQETLASKLGLKGKTSISAYEVDKNIPSDLIKLRMCEVFDVSMDYLMGRTQLSLPIDEIEKRLSEMNLSPKEYDAFMMRWTIQNSLNINELNRVDLFILDIYIKFLFDAPIQNEMELNLMINNINQVTYHFTKILKSINKEHVIAVKNTNVSNILPTVGAPVKLPIIGKIAAGLPILAIENIIDYGYAPSSYIKEDYNYFFLKVVGDSMNRCFNEGDIILVQQQDYLDDNDVGVILIDDEATVKKYRNENELIILEPMSTNPEYRTQIYNIKEHNIKIIGKVIAYQGRI